MKSKYIFFMPILTLLFAGCSSAPDKNETPITANTNNEIIQEDTMLDGYNDAMHSFNDGAYSYVLNPLGEGIEYITPDFIEDAFFSILENLTIPNTALNNALQGKLSSAGQDLARFGINSTIGVLGVFDWASMMGIPKNEEDLGQTLAVYGVPSGPAVVLPIFGVATPRGMSGLFINYNPINAADGNLKYLVDNIQYTSMLLDSSGPESYPSLEKQKQLFAAYRHCSINDGASIAKQSCDIVCEEFSTMMKLELASIKDLAEKKEMIEMGSNFMPSYCKIEFDLNESIIPVQTN